MNTEILEVRDNEYGYTEFFVNGVPVSQYAISGKTPKGNVDLYEVADYQTGIMYQRLFEYDAKRLALQIATAQAYWDQMA